MDAGRQYLIIQLVGTSYALDIGSVQEIIRLPALTPMPQAIPGVVGLTNLRSSIVPVLDLRQCCGLPTSPPTAATRVVVVQQTEQRLGLVVDGVDEVTTLPAASIEPVAAIVHDGRAERLVSGVARVENRLVLLLDLRAVLTREQDDALATLAV